MMAQYVKRPLLVEATQYNGSSTATLPDGAHVDPAYRDAEGVLILCAQLWVEKSDAWCDLHDGDYIVTEPDGVGFYPCAQAIFEAGHEQADRHPVA